MAEPSTAQSATNPLFIVKVDIEKAMAYMTRLTNEKIPVFLKSWQMNMALEGRKLMVQFSSSPYINRRTGRLVSSIDIFSVPPNFLVGPTVAYAKWVYGGTDPYDIYPRTKKALFWIGAKHPVRHIHHPGIKARPAHLWARAMLIARSPGIAIATAKQTLMGGGE
jgi:hypothetical protein